MELYPEFVDKSIFDAVRRRRARSPFLASQAPVDEPPPPCEAVAELPEIVEPIQEPPPEEEEAPFSADLDEEAAIASEEPREVAARLEAGDEEIDLEEEALLAGEVTGSGSDSLGDQVMAEIEEEPEAEPPELAEEERVYGAKDADEDIGSMVNFDVLPKSQPKRVLGKAQSASIAAPPVQAISQSDSQKRPTRASDSPEFKPPRSKKKASLLDSYFKGL